MSKIVINEKKNLQNKSKREEKNLKVNKYIK